MATAQPRQIRVPDDLWAAFDEATFAMGTDRSKALVAFMRRYVAAVTQPPIVPGPDPQQPGPYTLANVLPVSKPPRHRGVALSLMIGAGAAVILAALATSALLLVPRFAGGAKLVGLPPAKTALRTAYEACGQRGELSDGDHTLYLDMAGTDPDSGTTNLADLSCVFGQLKTPEYVIHEMGQTTALNGRQSDTWGDFSASWTYHPDNGLDVLFRQVKG